MISLKEKIADFYFRNHKIEDTLGNDPHLEESMLGKLQNTATNVRARTAGISFALATGFNTVSGLHNHSLAETAIYLVMFAGINEWAVRRRERNSSPDYYVDTAPQGEVTYPDDEEVTNAVRRNYEENSPQSAAKRKLLFLGISSAISYSFGAIEFIPLFAAYAATESAEEGRKYWQARQVLHENWQLYTTKPEKQTERSKQPQSAPGPNA